MGTRPDIAGLRVFGCVAHVHVPKQQRVSKLSPRSTLCFHMGYCTESKAYRLYDPTTNKIIISRDVIFDELRFADGTRAVVRRSIGEGEPVQQIPDATAPQPPARSELDDEDMLDMTEALDGDADAEDNNHADPDDDGPASYQLENVASDSEDEMNHLPLSQLVSQQISAPAPARPSVRRSQRGGGLPSSRALDAADHGRARVALVLSAAAVGVHTGEDDPTTYSQAMSRDDCQQWTAAMKSELDSIDRTGTWVLVPLPPGRQPIGCKWVYKIKRKADGSVDRYKARVVAKGFLQKEGVDYTETFAPVAKFTSIRVLLALAAQHDWEIHQMDVKTAFLHGDLDVDIYMRQPEGFAEPGKEDLVCQLKKSLYGLKQASRAWYQKIDAALAEMRFTSLASNHFILVSSIGKQLHWVVLE